MAAAAEGTVIACHSKDEFDAQMAKAGSKLVVIDFMSPRCGPCIDIAPVFAECANKYPTKALFLKIDTDQHELEEVASQYYCFQGAVPTFVFVRNDLTLESFVGAFPDKLRNTVKEFIDNPLASAARNLPN